MDKIPYVACLIHAFLGQDIPDAECVRIFLELKNTIGNEMIGTITAKGTSGVEFVFFLAAFNSLKGISIHSSTSQLTIFHLSECLTIINSYKSSSQRMLLLVSKDPTKNTNTNVISNIDVPSLQVTCILHILYGIITSNVNLELNILSDVLGSALRMFLKIALHGSCPSNLRKAYIHLVVTLLDKKSTAHQHIESTAFETDLIGSIASFLKQFNGEVLRDVIIMTNGLISSYPSLSTAFVSALKRLPEEVRLDLLYPTKKYVQVSWDAPFLFDKDYKNVPLSWWSFGIAMGLLNLTSSSNTPLDGTSLLILHSVLLSETNKKEGIDDTLAQNDIDKLLDLFALPVIAALAVQETATPAWDVFGLFMVLSSTETVMNVFVVN
jgi:hypothetical protein